MGKKGKKNKKGGKKPKVVTSGKDQDPDDYDWLPSGDQQNGSLSPNTGAPPKPKWVQKAQSQIKGKGKGNANNAGMLLRKGLEEAIKNATKKEQDEAKKAAGAHGDKVGSNKNGYGLDSLVTDAIKSVRAARAESATREPRPPVDAKAPPTTAPNTILPPSPSFKPLPRPPPVQAPSGIENAGARAAPIGSSLNSLKIDHGPWETMQLRMDLFRKVLGVLNDNAGKAVKITDMILHKFSTEAEIKYLIEDNNQDKLNVEVSACMKGAKNDMEIFLASCDENYDFSQLGSFTYAENGEWCFTGYFSFGNSVEMNYHIPEGFKKNQQIPEQRLIDGVDWHTEAPDGALELTAVMFDCTAPLTASMLDCLDNTLRQNVLQGRLMHKISQQVDTDKLESQKLDISEVAARSIASKAVGDGHSSKGRVDVSSIASKLISGGHSGPGNVQLTSIASKMIGAGHSGQGGDHNAKKTNSGNQHDDVLFYIETGEGPLRNQIEGQLLIRGLLSSEEKCTLSDLMNTDIDLTAAMLSCHSPQDQDKALRKRLVHRIKRLDDVTEERAVSILNSVARPVVSSLSADIVKGMFVHQNVEMLEMLQSEDILRAKIKQAVKFERQMKGAIPIFGPHGVCGPVPDLELLTTNNAGSFVWPPTTNMPQNDDAMLEVQLKNKIWQQLDEAKRFELSLFGGAPKYAHFVEEMASRIMGDYPVSLSPKTWTRDEVVSYVNEDEGPLCNEIHNFLILHKLKFVGKGRGTTKKHLFDPSGLITASKLVWHSWITQNKALRHRFLVKLEKILLDTKKAHIVLGEMFPDTMAEEYEYNKYKQESIRRESLDMLCYLQAESDYSLRAACEKHLLSEACNTASDADFMHLGSFILDMVDGKQTVVYVRPGERRCDGIPADQLKSDSDLEFADIPPGAREFWEALSDNDEPLSRTMLDCVSLDFHESLLMQRLRRKIENLAQQGWFRPDVAHKLPPVQHMVLQQTGKIGPAMVSQFLPVRTAAMIVQKPTMTALKILNDNDLLVQTVYEADKIFTAAQQNPSKFYHHYLTTC